MNSIHSFHGRILMSSSYDEIQDGEVVTQTLAEFEKYLEAGAKWPCSLTSSTHRST